MHSEEDDQCLNPIQVFVYPDGPVIAGNTYAFDIVLQLRQLRLEAGASIRLAVPIGWSPPTREPDKPGAIEWRVSGHALLLGEITRCRYLQLNITGGLLQTGDTISVAYGVTRDGGVGARVQPWVLDIQPAFEIDVDADGDGTCEISVSSPVIDVRPAHPSYLYVVLPSVAAPRSTVQARAAVLDSYGNLCTGVDGIATWKLMDSADETEVLFSGGVASWDIYLEGEGPRWVETRLKSYNLKNLSNPCLVTPDPEKYRVYWGDIHGHSILSDGAGSADFYHRYARDVSLLDFCCLTDHDIEYHHAWFTRKVQRLGDDAWRSLAATIQKYRIPGAFAVLRGYEWTGRPFGDKCVYYAEDTFPIYRYETGGACTPQDLWEKLGSLDRDEVVVVAHTPTSSFMGTRWSYHSADLERCVEIYSMHGSSEYSGDAIGISGSVPGRSVQDVLNQGLRLGITAGGDTHSSQPGNPCLSWGPYRTLRHKAGLTGLFSSKLDERALICALRNRRCLGTTGARILVYFAVNGVDAGGEVCLDGAEDSPVISLEVYGTSLIDEVEVIRNGEPVCHWKPCARSFNVTWTDSDFREMYASCAYYYVRVRQNDNEKAWSSPIWVRK